MLQQVQIKSIYVSAAYSEHYQGLRKLSVGQSLTMLLADIYMLLFYIIFKKIDGVFSNIFSARLIYDFSILTIRAVCVI